VRVEPERGDPAGDLALVEPVVLQVLEQVAGEPQLGRRDGMPARQLEGERGLAVVEHEPVVLGRLAGRMRNSERRDRATCDDR